MFKRPKIISLLALFFSYSLYRDIGMILNLSTSSDYLLFKEVGLGYVFFIFFTVIILANLYVVLNYWRPKPLGFWIAILSLITNIIETIVLV